MSDVPACPECNTSNPYHRRSSVQHFNHDHAYRCENSECGARFDDPVWREPETGDCIPGDSMAARLDKADPSEVGL